uniref:F-box domain-containing protein n=1 Tax=Steinernema glaseri TaxID=37863 RepID=A0A1I8AIU9_9BILA
MNGIPIVFYDRVFSGLYTHSLEEAIELSGTFGERARCAYLHYAGYESIVENNIEIFRNLSYDCSGRILRTPKEIAAFPKKFVRGLTIYLKDAENKNVCRDIVKRFPYAMCRFILRSHSVDEAWIHFACSLRNLKHIVITKKLEDDSLRLLKKLVDCGNLLELQTCKDACEGEQFEDLVIVNDDDGPWESDVVRTILKFWTKNSAKLRGKNLFVRGKCKEGVKQLEEFVIHRKLFLTFPTLAGMPGVSYVIRRLSVLGIQWALKRCSKEECDSIQKYYRHHHIRFWNPSCVYKCEQEKEREDHRLYISFELSELTQEIGNKCERIANHTGPDHPGLMRDTRRFHVLFA